MTRADKAGRPWHTARPVVWVPAVVVLAAAWVFLGAIVLDMWGRSRIHRRYAVGHARATLKMIAIAECRYKQEHGRYGALQGLLDAGTTVPPLDSQYEFEVELDGDTFTATARHRTRPDTRRAFRVGPDGVVKPVE